MKLTEEVRFVLSRIEALEAYRDELLKRVSELEAERDHWRSNCQDQVRRKQETHKRLRSTTGKLRETLETLDALEVEREDRQ